MFSRLAEWPLQYVGELAGLAAAFAWAITSLIFIRVDASAGAINLFKNSASFVFLVATVLFLALDNHLPLAELAIFHVDGRGWWYLFLSSVIGLTIGDTFYFLSLQKLGPRRCLMVTTLCPPMGAGLGLLFLDEHLGVIAWVGIVLTVLGVISVVRERTPDADRTHNLSGKITVGTLYGLAGAFGNSLGALYSKEVLVSDESNNTLSALEVTLLRMFIAMATGFAWFAVRGRVGEFFRSVKKDAAWKKMLPASFLGTYLGVWLCIIAYERTALGIATPMHSTSPIFVLPLAYLVHKQKVSWRAFVGALVAIGGIALLFVK